LIALFQRNYGGPKSSAMQMANGWIYQQLHRQASMLAYLDIIAVFTIFCACMIPLLFFIPRPPKHRGAPAAH
jgi:DHA2 family multidrug resistance protein